jgi:HAD superfamily hydrolase (TIGR01509 family)
MIKAVIFDMDGVLVDADKWHYNALNVALQHADVEPISWQEHLTVYKGIPTREKLRILTERKGLDPELWPIVAKTKQDVTQQIIESFSQPDGEKIEMLRLLSRRYPIVVCSNSIRRTVDVMLEGAGLTEFIDFTLSNEDIERPKPDPQVYFAAFERLGLRPDECVVIEDSDVGKAAATASGAVLCSVNDPADVNYYRVMRTIRDADRVNVVIPAAGQGKRFAEVGYQHPKPLIDVDGRPMIDLVLENFRGVGRPIVLLQDRHVEQYCADSLIKHLAPDGEVVGVDGLTEGAACTVLLAEHLIDNQNELVLANSDQVVEVSIEAFVQEMRDRGAHGGILTFKSDHPKWSYARVEPDGRVLEVAEKVVISDQATVGIYYFRHGADFVRFAKQMIAKDIRVNGEFYVCPVFNELVQAGLDVFVSEIEPGQMHGLGTPEDLEAYTTWRNAAPLRVAA